MNVTLHYLFSKNDKIGSKIIIYGTKHLETVLDTPSHVAILVNNRWVFESTLETGVRRISYKKWLEINTEVAKIECPSERTLEEVLGLFRRIKDKKYDYLGVTYFGGCIALNKFFGMKVPKKNRLQSPNKYFCCEVMGELLGLDYQMRAPVQLMVESSKLIEDFKTQNQP